MGKVRVSVIIPTYNRAGTVTKAINSVLAQTLRPYEIIVCDDGSTDRTIEELKSKHGNTLRYIQLKHSGLPSVARNAGIREAKGEWIAFLDSDDIWFPNKLKKQLEYLKESGLSISSTNAIRKRPNKKQSTMLQGTPNRIKYSDLVKVNWVVSSSVIAKKNLLRLSGGFPEDPKYKAYEDWVLWMRISTITDIGYLEEPLVTYYDNPVTSVRSAQEQWDKIKRYLQTDIIRWARKALYKHPAKMRLLKSIIELPVSIWGD